MHKPVLLQKTIDLLNLSSGKIFLDGTVGDGGHAVAVCERFGGSVQIVALDASREALQRAKQRLGNCPAVFVQENFRNLDRALVLQNIGRVDAALFDLGVSSFELDVSGRGFSFLRDEPLRMTYDESAPVTARDAVNEWKEETLAAALFGFGEERYARRIARGIVSARRTHPIERTTELAEIVRQSVPFRYRNARIHPATRTFQAIRVAVNDELGALSEGLTKAFEVLSTGGRCVVISFQSLEDRLVKRFFASKAAEGRMRIVTKKPLAPDREEILENPRSRSARLRAAEKLA